MHNARSDCRKLTHPRCHWTKKKGQWKPKKCFTSKEEAIEVIQKCKYKNYRVYKCPICSNLHIGYVNDKWQS